MARIHAEVGKLVNRPALFVEFRERLPIGGQRTLAGAALDSSPRLFQLDFERHDQRAAAGDPVAIFSLSVSTAAVSDHLALRSVGEHLIQRFGLELAKSLLPYRAKDSRHRLPGAMLQESIQIDETASQLARQQRTDTGLAGAHEPHQEYGTDLDRACHRLFKHKSELSPADRNTSTSNGE